MFKHHKAIAACWVVLFAFALAGCSSSDNQMTMEPTEPTEPTEPSPVKQELAELRAAIAALREQLGITDDDDVGSTIADLQREARTLTEELEAKQKAEAEAAAVVRDARLRELEKGIGSWVQNRNDPDPHVRADTTRPATASDGDTPTSISGWTGESWSAGTTTAIIYSDKGPGTPTPFNLKWGPADSNSDGLYDLKADDHGELVSLAGVPTNPNHKPLVVGPVQGLRGTFDGIPGTFTGTGGTGTNVNIDTDGNPTWDNSKLKFTPDDNTAAVTVADGTYMNLGYWLTEAESGAITPEVAAWVTTDEAPYAIADGLSLEAARGLIGKATFKGIAVGQYTHATVTAIEGGAFQADATLVAEFGNAPTPLAFGTLNGTIDRFMANGQPIGSGWKVEMGYVASKSRFDPESAMSLTSLLIGSRLRILTGWPQSPGEFNARGTFGSQQTFGYWGSMLLDASRNDDLPGAVGGSFHIGEPGHPIRMMGAFAATNQVPDLPDN